MCTPENITSLCLIDKSLIFKTHSFVVGGGRPDDQRVSVTAFLQSEILVNDLTANSHNFLVPLPQHDEPLKSVHNAGQPHGVPLVDNHFGALCCEGRGGIVFDAVVVGIILNLLVVILIVVVPNIVVVR